MSISKKGSQTNDTKLNVLNKATTLNPNAVEFVPSFLKSSSSPSGSVSKTAEATASFVPCGNLRKAVLSRSDSSVSNASDKEAHQFWHQLLPEDITPDFKDMSADGSQGLGALSFFGLSLLEADKVLRFPDSTVSAFVLTEQQKKLHHLNGSSFAKKMRDATSSFGDDPTSASFLNLSCKPWDKQMVNADHLLGNGIGLHSFNGSMGHVLMSNVVGKQSLQDDTDMNPLKVLASQFPGFAAESLAEVYVANGCDLNLTAEMLTQLELQVDGGFNQNVSSKALSAPNLTAMDFATLPVVDGQSGPPKYPRGHHQSSANPYRSSEKDHFLISKSSTSYASGGATDFASAVRKLASHDLVMWKYNRSSSADSTVGSSRSSNVLASSYGMGHGRGVFSDRLQSRGTARATLSWVETGEAVANMYTELRGEAPDHARLRNIYFEQARQAYLVGNKALARELSGKGQLHNMHMKAAHGKAQESIYRQRNPVGQEVYGGERGNEQMIDLHGLHVSEAILVLKHELNALRSTARLAEQSLQVYILVGMGHHTKGARTPARLPIVVQRYLHEEEGLDYSEPQPGLLQVVIY